MTDNPYYFAYGSNLCVRQFARRCPGSTPVGGAIVHGYRLIFPRRCSDWSSGVAGIEPHDTAFVEGGLYTVTDDDLLALDEYEGLGDDPPHYRRGYVRATLHDGRAFDAITYFAFPEPGGPFAPSPAYLDTMLRGARAHRLSPTWLDQLSQLAGEAVS